MWIPHVLSKLVTHPEDGDLDEYHVLTQQRPGDHKLAEIISRRAGLTEQRSVAFIHDAGDRLYIGIDGRVLDILGPDHRVAFEVRQTRQGPQRCRPIVFVHGYFAPKDGNVSIPDLKELVAEQRVQIDEILQRANDEGAILGRPLAVSPVEFSAKRATGTDWDKYAREFEAGRHPGETATFTKDGKLFRWLESLQPQPNRQPTIEKKSHPTISITTHSGVSLLEVAKGATEGAILGLLVVAAGLVKGAVRGAMLGALGGVTVKVLWSRRGTRQDRVEPKAGADP